MAVPSRSTVSSKVVGDWTGLKTASSAESCAAVCLHRSKGTRRFHGPQAR